MQFTLKDFSIILLLAAFTVAENPLRVTMNNRHLPFWMLAISSIVVLSLSVLIQDGMFMDAVLYSSVAHNEAIGYGTFWNPQYSTLNIAGLTSFHEQPPLVFGIVSLFFRVLGNSIYTERIYTFVVMCVTMALMATIWNELYKDSPRDKKFVWLVYILWIANPTVYWQWSNNMCENTMGIFTISSVLVSYKALRSGTRSVLPWILSGIMIFLATFSKGFPGFFPLSVPFLYYFIVSKDKISRPLLQTFILLAVPLLIYGVLFSIPVSRDSLSVYLFKRALHRIGNDPTVEYRAQIFLNILSDLTPPLIIMLFVFLFARRQKIDSKMPWRSRQAWFFIIVGLSASCPIALTRVQKDMYLTPAFPYIAVAMAVFLLPVISQWVESVSIGTRAFRILLWANAVLLAGSVVYLGSCYGQVNREQDMIHDVYLIGKEVPKFSTVSVPDSMYNEYDFRLHGFLMRYDNVSISPYKRYDYYLIEKNMPTAWVPAEYRKLSLPTLRYDLYKR